MSIHNLCFELKYEKYQIFFFLKTFSLFFFLFFVVKISIHLNRRVVVMLTKI